MTLHIIFSANVTETSVKKLMDLINTELKKKEEYFIIHISSPGGNVFWGITAYNFLKGIQAKIETNNLGGADSIATIIYCAGDKRYCSPHARFMMHGVGITLPQNVRLEEKNLLEKLKSLQKDTENIAGVLAQNTGKSEDEITNSIYEGTVLNPEEAKEYGLVHEIREKLYGKSDRVVTIS